MVGDDWRTLQMWHRAGGGGNGTRRAGHTPLRRLAVRAANAGSSGSEKMVRGGRSTSRVRACPD